jgi:mRNA interferase RelE/StbE
VVDPGYEVEFRPDAQNDLAGLDKQVAQSVLDRIKWLAQHFDEIEPEPLRGQTWRGVFRLRAGAYRVLYTVNREHRKLSIHRVGHRRDIYKAK